MKKKIKKESIDLNRLTNLGCYLIGPRKGRFSESNKVVDFPGHSVPLTALGAFILILGFLSFNGGSQGSISEEGDADTVALAIVNTILGMLYKISNMKYH